MTYELVITYSGRPNPSLDGEIDAIAGECMGSGYSVVEDQRDLFYNYGTEFEARRTRKRLLTEVPTHPVAIAVEEPYVLEALS